MLKVQLDRLPLLILRKRSSTALNLPEATTQARIRGSSWEVCIHICILVFNINSFAFNLGKSQGGLNITVANTYTHTTNHDRSHLSSSLNRMGLNSGMAVTEEMETVRIKLHFSLFIIIILIGRLHSALLSIFGFLHSCSCRPFPPLPECVCALSRSVFYIR